MTELEKRAEYLASKSISITSEPFDADNKTIICVTITGKDGGHKHTIEVDKPLSELTAYECLKAAIYAANQVIEFWNLK